MNGPAPRGVRAGRAHDVARQNGGLAFALAARRSDGLEQVEHCAPQIIALAPNGDRGA